MARKPKYPGGTDKKIVESATKLFFENGYEGTSVRSIVKSVDCEVGLFYYYYRSKDHLFTEVIETFLAPYNDEFAKLVDYAKENPSDGLYHFFDEFKNIVKTFRKKYTEKMHKTIRWAIREHILTAIEPYVEEIVQLAIGNGAKHVMDVKATSIFMSHGVGSLVIREDEDVVESISDDIKKAIDLLIKA